MALIFIDGFESEQNIQVKGWSSVDTEYMTQHSIDSTIKRSNGASLKLMVGWIGGSPNPYRYYKEFDVDTSVLTIGFGQRHGFNVDQTFFEIYPDDGARYIYFTQTASDQKIRMYNNGVLLGVTTTSFAINTQYYLQIKVVADAINGQAVLLVGNQTELNITDLNTSTNNNRLNRIGFIGKSISGLSQWIDDMYVLDQAAPLNTFIGVCSVIGSLPSATADSTGFQVSGANSLYEAVDDASTSSLDYIYASNVNDKAVFDLTDVATTGQIKGVLFHDYAARSEAGQGVSKYKFICQDATGQEYESNDVSLTASLYSSHYFIFENNPITDSTQTQEDFNTIKAGFKLTQSS